jgi:mannitol/fructose-specific phosphotransferase system IIA component (Ntr-type)
MSSMFSPGLVDPRLAFPHLVSRTRDAVLSEMAALVAEAGVVPNADRLADRLLKRERDGCTGVGQGVAFPHCRVEGLNEVVVAVGLSPEGIDFGATDGIPITVLFLLLSSRGLRASSTSSAMRIRPTRSCGPSGTRSGPAPRRR